MILKSAGPATCSRGTTWAAEAIGYDLYCRMLEDTIREIRGEAHR